MKLKNHQTYLIKLATLFSLYYITAQLGLSLDPVSGFASLIWLPSGIALASLLIFGLKLWPAITLGAFLANLVCGAAPLAALGISIGNTLEPLIGAYLLRYFQFNNSLERVNDVLRLTIIAGVLSTLISATIGVFSLWFAGQIADSALVATWMPWWVGDMVSVLTVTPLILVLSNNQKIDLRPSKLTEIIVVVLLLLAIYFGVFRDLFGYLLKNNPSTYMAFPPLIWAALRFGPKGVVVIIFLLSILTTASTLEGFGPFTVGSLSENLLFLQIYMTVTSVTSLILAAVVAERQQVEKTKDDFISIASHELRTPITTLKGYSQLLQQHLQKKGDKKAFEYTSRMTNSINSLSRLITDFFDVSKVSAGKMELEKEKFNFDLMVKEVVADMKRLSPKYKITIVGATKKDIFADRYRICQVLINLLSNAVKFSPKADQIKVYLSVHDDYVGVSVQDFGIGISKRDVKNVFERFFQADTNIRQSSAGLGLGLYISAEIVKRHNGKIWVKSIKGQGSTFSFSLPINNRV